MHINVYICCTYIYCIYINIVYICAYILYYTMLYIYTAYYILYSGYLRILEILEFPGIFFCLRISPEIYYFQSFVLEMSLNFLYSLVFSKFVHFDHVPYYYQFFSYSENI